METQYKKLDNTVIENVGQYIKESLEKMPLSKVYIGTDSQNHDDWTIYATAIVIHWHGDKGGHVLYTKDKVPRIRDRFTKLWGEVQRSVDVANYLKKECNIPIEYIDLDLNANAKWDSNKVLKPAVGYVESLGYEARFKPGPAYAVRIADVLCR
jgi:predicted RNase H-related nuclease YkuK (DUF458 family)